MESIVKINIVFNFNVILNYAQLTYTFPRSSK